MIQRIFRCGLALAILAGLMAICTCQTQKDRNAVKVPPQRDIVAVMNAHVDSLMTLPGVTGVAIGELPDKTPCIQVLILENTEVITRDLPKEIEGYPVDIMVTGVIRPMDGQ